MIDVTIKMTLPAEKRHEVLQSVKSLLVPIRNEPGCLGCYCWVDAEVEQIIVVKQEWQTNQALTAFLKSDHFNILLGMMQLLSIEPEIRFNTIASTAGAEVIAAARTPGNAVVSGPQETEEVRLEE